MGLVCGLLYAYVGLVVVTFTVDYFDEKLDRKIGNSLFYAVSIIVLWVVLVPTLMLLSYSRRWYRAYKLSQRA